MSSSKTWINEKVRVLAIALVVPCLGVIAYGYTEFREASSKFEKLGLDIKAENRTLKKLQHEDPIFDQLKEYSLAASFRLKILQEIDLSATRKLDKNEVKRLELKISLARYELHGHLGAIRSLSKDMYPITYALAEAMKQQLEAEKEIWLSIVDFIKTEYSGVDSAKEDVVFQKWFLSLLNLIEANNNYGQKMSETLLHLENLQLDNSQVYESLMYRKDDALSDIRTGLLICFFGAIGSLFLVLLALFDGKTVRPIEPKPE